MNAEASPPEPTRSRDWYLDHVLADVERFAAAVRTGPLTSPVGACPGWDLRQLTAHQGQVHRWAMFCAANSAPPDDFAGLAPDPDLDADALATWLTSGCAELVDVLRAIDLDGPTWHPFPVPRVGRVWPRRQAHEISVHRWDAERAVASPAPIEPELASDGIDEYLELVVPRLVKRDKVALPAGSLHLHCTDTDGEWLVSAEGGDYQLVRAHQKGDAALRGPAEALLLRLWNRDSPRAGELSPVGDESVLGAWLGLAGI